MVLGTLAWECQPGTPKALSWTTPNGCDGQRPEPMCSASVKMLGARDGPCRSYSATGRWPGRGTCGSISRRASTCSGVLVCCESLPLGSNGGEDSAGHRSRLVLARRAAMFKMRFIATYVFMTAALRMFRRAASTGPSKLTVAALAFLFLRVRSRSLSSKPAATISLLILVQKWFWARRTV